MNRLKLAAMACIAAVAFVPLANSEHVTEVLPGLNFKH